MSESTRIDETNKWLTQYQLERSRNFFLDDRSTQAKILEKPEDIRPTSSRRRTGRKLASKTIVNDWHGVSKKIETIEDARTRKMLQALSDHFTYILAPSKQNPQAEEVYARVNDSIFDSNSGFKVENLTQALQIFSERIGVESFILPREYGVFFENKTPFITGGKYILKFVPLENGKKMPIIEEMDPHLARFLDRSYAQASYINGKINKPVFFVNPAVRDGDECIVDELAEYGLREFNEIVGDNAIIKDMGGTPVAVPKRTCDSVEEALNTIDRTMPPHELEWLIENHDLKWDKATNSIVVMGQKEGSTEGNKTKAYKMLFTALPALIGVREATAVDAVALDLLAQ